MAPAALPFLFFYIVLARLQVSFRLRPEICNEGEAPNSESRVASHLANSPVSELTHCGGVACEFRPGWPGAGGEAGVCGRLTILVGIHTL